MTPIPVVLIKMYSPVIHSIYISICTIEITLPCFASRSLNGESAAENAAVTTVIYHVLTRFSDTDFHLASNQYPIPLSDSGIHVNARPIKGHFTLEPV